MNFDFNFLLMMMGGTSMIAGWILYHFFDIPFMEAIKLVTIGLIVLFYTIYRERQYIQEVQHE